MKNSNTYGMDRLVGIVKKSVFLSKNGLWNYKVWWSYSPDDPGPSLDDPRLPNHGIPTTGVDVVDSLNRPEAQVCFPLSQNLQDYCILITSITQRRTVNPKK